MKMKGGDIFGSNLTDYNYNMWDLDQNLDWKIKHTKVVVKVSYEMQKNAMFTTVH